VRDRKSWGHNQPKTTLVVKGVPQGMTSDMIKTELENQNLHVRSCQVSTTREPGEWNGVGYIEMGRVPDAAHIIEHCKVQNITKDRK
jgi:hypothetical protein